MLNFKIKKINKCRHAPNMPPHMYNLQFIQNNLKYSIGVF